MKNFQVYKKNLGKKALALTLMGTMAFTSGCGINKKVSNTAYTEVIEEFKNDTQLDEAIQEGIAVYDNMSITEASDMLIDYINVVETLEDIDFSEIKDLKPLAETDYNIVIDGLDDRKLDLLIETAKDNGESLLTEERRHRALKILNNLNEEYKQWIKVNGYNVSVSAMKYALKSSLAEELSLSADEISKIKIDKKNKADPSKFSMTYEDKSYQIDSLTAKNAIMYIYDMQETDEGRTLGDDAYYTYKTAINNAKQVTMTGMEKRKGNKIKARRRLKVAIEKFENE